MNPSIITRTTSIQAVLFLTVAIAFVPASFAAERLRIYTVNYPLQYFAQRIAGEHAEVVFPAPRDFDPAFWTPDIETVSDYQGADLILLNGANYAKWIDRVSLPRRRLVNTSKAFSDQFIKAESSIAHSHGSGPTHGHGGTAFTTWLDLRQAILQAASIKQALIRKRPQAEADFEANFANLERDLRQTDAELRSIADSGTEQTLLASHPVYQYLARAYGLELYSLLWEPDEFPDDRQWKELVELATTRRNKWMIWEKAPLTETTARLKQMGIDTIVFDPCANVPEQGDFLSVMKNNLSELKRVSSPDLSSLPPMQSTADNGDTGS